jgi:HSP20 family protein
MTMKRFDPVEEMRPLPVAPFANLSEQIGTEAPLAYDVYRSGDDLCIDFDVPGVDPSSIHLTLENQFLTVAVTRELPGTGIEVIERGRVHGLFERRLVLPTQWQVEDLRATVEHGVLHLQAPLRAAHLPKTVKVEAVGPRGSSAATVETNEAPREPEGSIG